MIDVQVVVKDTQVKRPVYATKGSAGMDLFAHSFSIYDEKEGKIKQLMNPEGTAPAKVIKVRPGNRVLVGTGIFSAIPEGYELQIRPRSGLALKQGVTVLNSPGTIDSDYRGEIGVIIVNNGFNEIILSQGDAIGQGVLATVIQANLVKVDNLPVTERGEGGFGSTGNGLAHQRV